MTRASSAILGVVAVVALVCAGCSSDSPSGGEPDAAAEAGVDAAEPDAPGGDAEPEPDASADAGCAGPVAPEPGPCAGDKMEVLTGKYQLVLNAFEIGGSGVGFDLDNADCDDDPSTGPDNVLWPLGALAKQSIDESMEAGDIVLSMEFFGVDDVKNDTCLNFALYSGRFAPDRDGDGEEAGGPLGDPGKDCNDHDAKIAQSVAEVAGNAVDDNCNGLADEDQAGAPGTDASDADGDGQTIAAGDCDDRKDLGATIKKGGPEVCGDGLDNDCNGFADDGCMPWSEGMSFPVEKSSVGDSNEGTLTFRGATIEDGVLRAGPARFAIAIDVSKNAVLDLNLTHVFVTGTLATEGEGIKLTDGLLGGVLSGRAMDQVPNLIADFGAGFGTADDSMLDAMVGPAGMLLALPTDSAGNRVPDIDVDGDGIEKFLDTDADGDTATVRVDTCVDGDGTVIEDKVDADGNVTEPCTMAKDASGNYRFVDGWSIALSIGAVPTKLEGISE